jgi:transcriptional regulator with XRE-family HTH domain
MKKATILALKNLKEFLKIKTDYELAKKLNVPQSTIARYSKGKNSISLDTLNEYFEKEELEIEIEINYKYKPQIKKEKP